MDTIQKIDLPGVISLSELVVDLLPDVISTLIGEDCFVQGDEDLVRAAIENILRNAIRYTPVDGWIHVEVLPVETSGEQLSVVRISDDGPGIPEVKSSQCSNHFIVRIKRDTGNRTASA